MRPVLALTLLAVTALMLAGACRGDAKKCELGCRNYATLIYPQIVDAEVAAAPADQRDAVRKRMLGEFDEKVQSGIDLCVSKCQSANNEADTECLIAAKTADQATACLK